MSQCFSRLPCYTDDQGPANGYIDKSGFLNSSCFWIQTITFPIPSYFSSDPAFPEFRYRACAFSYVLPVSPAKVGLPLLLCIEQFQKFVIMKTSHRLSGRQPCQHITGTVVSITNYVPSLSSRSLCESRAFVGSCIVYFYVLLYTQLGLCLEKI